MTTNIQGKVALVTGGGSGIGRATAQEFGRAGAKVVVADISQEWGEDTVKQIKGDGGEAFFIRADVSKSADTENMVRKTVEKYGRLDCAHNNAGIDGEFVTIWDGTEQNFDHVIAVNLKSVWLGMKYQVPVMRKQGGGAIVNTGSVASYIGYRTMSHYVASKHGVVGLTKSVALEVSRFNIRVNAVCPGVIRTAMIDTFVKGDPATERAMIGMEPVGRMGTPEEVAKTVLWLCSDAASFVTGIAMPVDGGLLAQSGSYPPIPEEAQK